MNKKSPPKWAIKLIKWYSNPEFTQEIIGDLEEMFVQWTAEKGLFIARIFYIWNAILFIRIYNSHLKINLTKFNQIAMITHTIKLSLRNIRKHKVYNIGNILGLAIGISVSLMIFLHVSQELSYEKGYPKNDRIFRISSHNEWAKSPPSMAGELLDFFPQIEKTSRFAKYGGNTSTIGNNNQNFISSEVFYTDQSTIDVFDLQFKHGTPKDAINRPYTVIINSSIATKIFGDKNPIGQILEINEGRKKFEITGVINDMPEESHLKAEVLVSMATFYDQIPEDWTSSRGWMVMYTYALIGNQQNITGFHELMPEFMSHYLHEQTAEEMLATDNYFEIMPLVDIHLKSNRVQEMRANSSTAYVYTFIMLAIFIIIIAGVNFVNIFTTLAFKRVKEVGIRKIVGAHRNQLIFQLLFEACVSSIIAASLGLILCLLSLPYYNNLVDLSITKLSLIQPSIFIILFSLSMMLGLVSGLYPSLLVTRQKITESILNNSNPKANISFFRRGLIVFQFALSLFILISTMVVSKQMNFIQEKDLGYDTDQLITAKIYGNLAKEVIENYRGLFTTLKENSNIKNVSMASNLMGDPLSVEYFTPANADPEKDFGSTNMVWTDENYLNTMGIELLKGRDFRPKTDTTITFLVSEQLTKTWNKDVIGTMGEFRGEKGEIVGVFKDINYYSLHDQIEPLAICLRPSWANNLLFKIDGKHSTETIDFIESKLKEKSPHAVIKFSFINDRLKQLYKNERNMFSAFKIFSIIAVIISCLGLLGIAAIEVQRRTKEVGIRKVLGASSSEILFLLSRQFTPMFIIAVLIGIPISYFSSQKWLTDYSYSITLEGWDFILPSVGLIFISLLVIGLHSVKIAKSNPTESLRSE